MGFQSCPMIAGLYLNINGRIDTGEKVLSLCCENIADIPAVAFADTAEETLERFIGMRTLLLAESLRNPQKLHHGCTKCANYRQGEWNLAPFISYVNLSMYPAPCQCRCCYCEAPTKEKFTPRTKAAYEKLFEMLELGAERGVIEPNATWQVSTGEITIHPYRDRILKLVEGKRAVFYTNAFRYDEDIARNLHDNPGSAINLSIDAGTPATWHKVKGVDNFDEVTDNLVRYYKNSARPGQITLKYIVLPDINDTYEDFRSLTEIAKVLEVKHITIARDVRIKYHIESNERTKLAGAAAYLLAMCHKSGIENDMFTFSAEEQQEVVAQANEILSKGLI